MKNCNFMPFFSTFRFRIIFPAKLFIYPDFSVHKPKRTVHNNSRARKKHDNESCRNPMLDDIDSEIKEKRENTKVRVVLYSVKANADFRKTGE